MGLHSEDSDIYQQLTSLGFFNPRTNTVSLLSISEIDDATLATVSQEIIGYKI